MKHYVASDLHGDPESFATLLGELAGKDYQLYFLGDAADRGPSGYIIIKWLLDNPHVIYLKGNHEDLFVRAAREFYRVWHKYWEHETLAEIVERHTIHEIMRKGPDMKLHMSNGGASTFLAWLNDGAPLEIIEMLDQLPLKASYKDYDMCHAGTMITSWEDEVVEDLIWDRDSFCEEWYPNRILVHGHTPVPLMPNYLVHQEQLMEDPDNVWLLPQDEEMSPEPLVYHPGARSDYPNGLDMHRGLKVDIDTGAVFTGCLTILDLDDGSVEVFSSEESTK